MLRIRSFFITNLSVSNKLFGGRQWVEKLYITVEQVQLSANTFFNNLLTSGIMHACVC